MHNVVETVQQECTRTVVDRVTETVNTDQCSTVTVPVTTYSTVQRDCGHWATQTVQHPGPIVNQCVCDPCTGCMKTCQVQCPGFTTCCQVWVPQVVTEQVPCTTYKCEVVHKTVPVQVVRCVPRTVVEKYPVQVCKTVCQEVVEKYPVQVCHYVCEQKVEKVPYCECHQVCETHSRQVPVTTYKTVQEVRTCKVAYCVPVKIAYQVDVCVPRCVSKTVPVTCTRHGYPVRCQTGSVRSLSYGPGDRVPASGADLLCPGTELRSVMRLRRRCSGPCRPPPMAPPAAGAPAGPPPAAPPAPGAPSA